MHEYSLARCPRTKQLAVRVFIGGVSEWLRCEQIRALDNQRILDSLLTKLTYKEILEIDKQVKLVLDIEV